MSKRVYEVAGEGSLESKEVMQGLKEAGVEVKRDSSSDEDSVDEQEVGPHSDGEAPHVRTEAQYA